MLINRKTEYPLRFLREFDWISFLLILVLSLISLAFVFSATYTTTSPYSIFFKKQLFGVGTGITIYLIMTAIDYRKLEQWGYFLFIATMALLLFTIFKGSIGLGAQRWINLGIIKFQPSELAKLFFPAFFTYHLFGATTNEPNFKAFLPILGVLGVSSFLILKQPDLGTALIILFSGALLLWLANIGRTFFICTGIFFIFSAPLSWRYLKPYQKKRVLVFLGGGTSYKERYQIEQSQIAIGSGGLFGKGYLQGTQNRLNFLPESRTDFIFSVICEELGFIGACSTLLLFFILFTRLIFVASSIKNIYAQLLAVGLILPIIISTIINISMVIGLLPIVGIPLPFITYGITHLWISFASLGWFNSIVCRRFLMQ